MSIQFVEVNGVMIPTTEFIKNRERLIQATKKNDVEKPVEIDTKKNLSDVKDVKLNNVQVEEKTLQIDSISEEKVKIEEPKEEIEEVILPTRSELVKEHKKVFGKYPAPKLTNEEMYLKIQKAKKLD